MVTHCKMCTQDLAVPSLHRKLVYSYNPTFTGYQAIKWNYGSYRGTVHVTASKEGPLQLLNVYSTLQLLCTQLVIESVPTHALTVSIPMM